MTLRELEAKAKRGMRIAAESYSYKTPMIGLKIPVDCKASKIRKAVKLFGGIGPKAHISIEHSDQAKGYLAVQVNAQSVVKWFQKARKHGWLPDAG